MGVLFFCHEKGKSHFVDFVLFYGPIAKNTIHVHYEDSLVCGRVNSPINLLIYLCIKTRKIMTLISKLLHEIHSSI